MVCFCGRETDICAEDHIRVQCRGGSDIVQLRSAWVEVALLEVLNVSEAFKGGLTWPLSSQSGSQTMRCLVPSWKLELCRQNLLCMPRFLGFGFLGSG